MSDILALYPGTFDPVTNGHIDLIQRGATLFGRLEVCVAVAGKRTHFSLDVAIDELLALVGILRRDEGHVDR